MSEKNADNLENAGRDFEVLAESLGMVFSPDENQIFAEYKPERPEGHAPKKRFNDNMERGQVQDMIAASEARVDAKFERLLSQFRETAAQTSGEIKDFGHSLDKQQTTMTALDTKLSLMQSDNIRTRGTVRTAAISLGFGLSSLFIAVVALILNGVFGSFNIGAKVSDTARAEAESVYAQKAAQTSHTTQSQSKNGNQAARSANP